MQKFQVINEKWLKLNEIVDKPSSGYSEYSEMIKISSIKDIQISRTAPYKGKFFHNIRLNRISNGVFAFNLSYTQDESAQYERDLKVIEALI